MLWYICISIVLIGCAYTVATAWFIRRLSGRTAARVREPRAVTVLKPLHGTEPYLEENLRTFDAQDYAGEVQVICGVGEATDAAAGLVRSLEGRTRHRFELAENAPEIGLNRKICNIANMMKLARHDVLVLSDSDMRVGPDYLSHVVAPFEDPAVGLVTCFYRGRPATRRFWPRLHATAIDHHFLPNAVFGTSLGLATPCFGSTIALSSGMLAKIGGFGAFRDLLADDYEIGRAVARAGGKTVIPPIVLEHVCSEATFGEVLAHELRWARTIRLIDPLGYAGSFVTHPFALSLLVMLIYGISPATLLLTGLALASRSLVPLEMRRAFRAEGSSIALGPIRDVLSFAVFILSFLPISLRWRGQRFMVRRDGTMASN